MARDETPPFLRGSTFYNGGLIDPNNPGGVNLEGKEWRFEDTNYGTNQYVTVRVVRNVNANPLMGSRLAQFDPAWWGNRVNGYTNVAGGQGVILDELLPPAGVPSYDLCYAIMEGPTLAYPDQAGGANNTIAPFDSLIALTAASTTSATAGRLYTATGATNKIIATALTARTTAQTTSKFLVCAHRWL